jgi:hypothetical protein
MIGPRAVAIAPRLFAAERQIVENIDYAYMLDIEGG